MMKMQTHKSALLMDKNNQVLSRPISKTAIVRVVKVSTLSIGGMEFGFTDIPLDRNDKPLRWSD
jgi:hypothetical protein